MASVNVGDSAPGFSLPGTGDRTYSLSDYAGRNLILAFYPGDDTRVCTEQFCSYRDEGERLDHLGAEILGISPQSVDSHERWAREQRLNVPLLADEDLAVARSYGVVGWASPLAKLVGLATTGAGHFVKRSIFLIDASGKVRHKHVSRTGATFQDVGQLEEAVSALG